jgi:hypothetical protein
LDSPDDVDRRVETQPVSIARASNFQIVFGLHLYDIRGELKTNCAKKNLNLMKTLDVSVI